MVPSTWEQAGPCRFDACSARPCLSYVSVDQLGVTLNENSELIILFTYILHIDVYNYTVYTYIIHMLTLYIYIYMFIWPRPLPSPPPPAGFPPPRAPAPTALKPLDCCRTVEQFFPATRSRFFSCVLVLLLSSVRELAFN